MSLCICTTFSFAIHPFDGQLACCHTLGIMNSAATNLRMQISLRDPNFNSFSLIEVRFGSYYSYIFNFLRNLYNMVTVNVPFYISANCVEVFQFLQPSPTFVTFYFN
jgi:hypothetical protein